MLKVFTDGGSRGNPGKAASAFTAYEDGKEIYFEKKYLGINTNNFAEYYAVLIALQYIVGSTKYKKIDFFSDSELMVRQLNGIYKIKNQTLYEMADKIKKLIIEKNLIVKFNHVLRSENKRADELVNKALDETTL